MSCSIYPGCKICTNSGCTVCELGKIYEMGICADCHASCENCSAGISATACTSCEPPAFLNDNNECVVCDPPCTACASGTPDVCLLCEDGYSLAPSTINVGECFRCDDRYCLICDDSDPTVCLYCQEGHFKKVDKCVPCPNNCDVCQEQSSTVTCEECAEGFFMNPNSICEPCAAGCALCSSKTLCE